MTSNDKSTVLDKLIAAALDKQEAAASKPSAKPAGPQMEDDEAEDDMKCRCGCALTCADCGKSPQECDC